MEIKEQSLPMKVTFLHSYFPFLFILFFSQAYFSVTYATVVEYQWMYQGRLYGFSFDAGDFDWCQFQYQSRPHTWIHQDRFIKEDPCNDSFAWFAKELWDMAEIYTSSTLEAVNFALNFVRGIPWETDSKIYNGDYVRYPYETLIDVEGDCEDHAVLFSAIMSHWCMDSILLDFPNHIAVAVNKKNLDAEVHGVNYVYKGNRYYFAEATPYSSYTGEEAYLGEAAEADKERMPKILMRIPRLCTVQ